MVTFTKNCAWEIIGDIWPFSCGASAPLGSSAVSKEKLVRLIVNQNKTFILIALIHCDFPWFLAQCFTKLSVWHTNVVFATTQRNNAHFVILISQYFNTCYFLFSQTGWFFSNFQRAFICKVPIVQINSVTSSMTLSIDFCDNLLLVLWWHEPHFCFTKSKTFFFHKNKRKICQINNKAQQR